VERKILHLPAQQLPLDPLCLTLPAGIVDLEELATMSNMFSPPRREKARDDSHLPKGDCRYILLHPEVKGLRCACVGFALNQAIPGSTCDCGHQACYHIPEKENMSLELEVMREKISSLEDMLNRERHGGRGGLVDRLGRLEEVVDKTKVENDAEFKSFHGRFKGVWEHIVALNKRTSQYDDNLEGLVDDVQRIRSQLVEVDDASMRLEDRVEALENSSTPMPSPLSRRRKASTPPSVVLDILDQAVKSEEFEYPASQLSTHLSPKEDASHVQRFRERVASVGAGAQSWTVHISLLPTSSQPFPFEKDTAAYKRCLSRGLHQMIVIPDIDSKSFSKAVDHAFARVLRGRPWEPLVARLCDAQNLRGLPMLRQLDDWLVGSDYDSDFLQKNCAVCDESGKILDLYLAMSNDSITWAELKEVTPFKDGLEESWTYDALLDGPEDEGH
jgi:hypothetical protein